MNNKFLHRKGSTKPCPGGLEQLEAEANDEFLLLDEIGAASFSTEHLYEMRAICRLKKERFTRLLRMNLALGFSAAGWLLFSMLLWQFNLFLMAKIAFAITCLVVLTSLGGAFLLKSKFSGLGEVNYILHTIEEELQRRKVRVW